MDANTEFMETENRMLRSELRRVRAILAIVVRSHPDREVRIDDRDIITTDIVSIEISHDDSRLETIIKVKGEGK